MIAQRYETRPDREMIAELISAMAQSREELSAVKRDLYFARVRLDSMAMWIPCLTLAATVFVAAACWALR
jgi:hypothetical protein